jgi:Nucleotidyl transferase AbiEii toxin, Type IV TA system
MSSKAAGLKSAIDAFIQRRGIEAGMEQNLMKEAIHLHLLSALSEAGILQHVIFQGGSALRLCYGGERYSEDLDFVCGRAGSYLKDVDFGGLVDKALAITKRTLQREFDIDAGQISHKRSAQSEVEQANGVNVATWQIVVPVGPTPNTPRSRIKIEFANVPSYDPKPVVVGVSPGLVQIPDVILNAETPHEILADKAVALTVCRDETLPAVGAGGADVASEPAARDAFGVLRSHSEDRASGAYICAVTIGPNHNNAPASMPKSQTSRGLGWTKPGIS